MLIVGWITSRQVIEKQGQRKYIRKCGTYLFESVPLIKLGILIVIGTSRRHNL